MESKEGKVNEEKKGYSILDGLNATSWLVFLIAMANVLFDMKEFNLKSVGLMIAVLWCHTHFRI